MGLIQSSLILASHRKMETSNQVCGVLEILFILSFAGLTTEKDSVQEEKRV